MYHKLYISDFLVLNSTHMISDVPIFITITTIVLILAVYDDHNDQWVSLTGSMHMVEVC